MKYFTYGYEDYNGNEGEVTVKANTKEEAWDKIHDYKVSRGELHYAWFKSESESESETEKYYSKDNKSLSLAIALAGAALGCSQIKQYGVDKKYTDCLKDNETMRLITQ